MLKGPVGSLTVEVVVISLWVYDAFLLVFGRVKARWCGGRMPVDISVP